MRQQINQDYSSHEYRLETYNLCKQYKQEWESGKVSKGINAKRMIEIANRLSLSNNANLD